MDIIAEACKVNQKFKAINQAARAEIALATPGQEVLRLALALSLQDYGAHLEKNIQNKEGWFFDLMARVTTTSLLLETLMKARR